MCDGDGSVPVTAVPDDVDAFRGQRIGLNPVERVTITTLGDNCCDILAADVGPAHRVPMAAWPAVGNAVVGSTCRSSSP